MTFAELVDQALEELPAEFRRELENVAIVIEDEPPEGQPWLGVYEGATTQYRPLSGKQPDRIRLFRGPMERLYGDDPEIFEREVRRLVRHEVAHHFGISDARLIELDRY